MDYLLREDLEKCILFLNILYLNNQPINEVEMLLYRTISTSIVTLDNSIYNDIFYKNVFKLSG